MKKTYIRPLCEDITIDNGAVLLAGSSNIIVNNGAEDSSTDITEPEYGGEEVPAESKLNPGYNVWGDDL